MKTSVRMFSILVNHLQKINISIGIFWLGNKETTTHLDGVCFNEIPNL